MSLQDRKAEFRAHVWDHSRDPFQMAFDECEPLSKEHLSALRKVATAIQGRASDTVLSKLLLREIQSGGEELLSRLLQISGLTRNKILTDIRAIIRSQGSKISVPSSFMRLTRGDAWALAGPYLAFKLGKVLEPVAPLKDSEFLAAIQAINQATWSGYIRQERAKRSGHEAESRLARVLRACGLPFVPIEKADNPLSGDVQIHEVSFDLVIPSLEQPSVCVKATVHTANIGQYGESKDHLEVNEATEMLDREFPGQKRPLLLAFIDGVGFESNTAGLEGVLSKADEFCQFRTLWKAVVVISARLGKQFRILLPQEEIEGYRAFLNHYNYAQQVQPLEKVPIPSNAVEAGDGRVTPS